MAANDQSLFAGTAWYYARYRKGYPQVFFDHVAKKFNLDGSGRLLDLGCGTGQITIPLARHFEEVIAVDPSEEMLQEAKRLAKEKGVKNIRWIKSRAEDSGKNIGRFKLATMGASFHWMDREKALNFLYEGLEPGGGAVIVWIGGIWGKTALADWQKTVKTVVQRWLGEKRRAGGGFYERSKESHEDIIAGSPFQHFEKFHHEFSRVWDVESVIGHLYSTSYSSRRLLGEHAAEFEKDIKEALRRLNPSGQFQERATLEAFFMEKHLRKLMKLPRFICICLPAL